MSIDGKALQVPGEFLTDGKKRPFPIDSHWHHTHFVLKKNSEETKNMQKISSCDCEQQF